MTAEVETVLRSILRPVMAQAWGKSKREAIVSLNQVVMGEAGGCRISPVFREARRWIRDNQKRIKKVITQVSARTRDRHADWGVDKLVEEWRVKSDETPHRRAA